MDFETQQELSQHINPSERILWAGRPKTGIIFRKTDIFVTLFSAVWLVMWTRGFGAFWKGEREISIDILFLLLGTVVGLYFLFGRFIHDAWRRSRTHYGLTEHRVLIITGTLYNRPKSIPLKSMKDISLQEKADGSGAIIFGSSGMAAFFKGHKYSPGFHSKNVPVIEEIQNVRSVYDQILSAQRNGLMRERSGYERDF